MIRRHRLLLTVEPRTVVPNHQLVTAAAARAFIARIYVTFVILEL